MRSFVFNNILASIVIFSVVLHSPCGVWLRSLAENQPRDVGQLGPRRERVWKNNSRQDAKAQRIAKGRCLPFFATFAYFAAWRETGLSVHGIPMWRSHPPAPSKGIIAQLSCQVKHAKACDFCSRTRSKESEMF